ncbi:aldo/keto reductase [Gryllotalpicola daejeonensis]|uniref:Aldo/keto reductase n=1 Tax=Gryllotalpicola daejeonensis TaxID=993087 RepID=A0ABP7ZMD8_9MICO
MSDYSPVGAREHISHTGRGALTSRDAELSGAAGSGSIFAADDAAFTRPVPIVAERRLADTELTTFPFALGTARLAAVDDVVAGRILNRFAVRGGSLYDVGDEDGSGRNQELVGRWLGSERLSKALTVLTPAVQRDGGRASGANRVVRAVEASLRALRLERVDLLMLDLRESAELGLAIDEVLGAADELVRAGKVRYLGATGATGQQLLEARVLAGNGLPRLSAIRLPWAITDKVGDAAEVRMGAAAQQLGILPDATTASLALTSPSLPPKVLASRGARLSQAAGARIAKPERERAIGVFASRGREHRIAVALDRVSAELDVPPATTQLAWLLAKRGVVAPIVSVTRAEQVDVLMDAAAVRLTRAQMLELDRSVETLR